MNFRKHKIIMTVASVVLLLGIFVTAIAVSQNKKPDIVSGSFKNLIADRIEITVENTDFTINKSSADIENVTLTMYLSVKKTQADFYGILNSLSFSGVAYNNMIFTAKNTVSEEKIPENLVLSATDGTPDTFCWQIDINLAVAGKGTYQSTLTIDYTTGLTQKTSQNRFVEIPITINVE